MFSLCQVLKNFKIFKNFENILEGFMKFLENFVNFLEKFVIFLENFVIFLENFVKRSLKISGRIPKKVAVKQKFH